MSLDSRSLSETATLSQLPPDRLQAVSDTHQHGILTCNRAMRHSRDILSESLTVTLESPTDHW